MNVLKIEAPACLVVIHHVFENERTNQEDNDCSRLPRVIVSSQVLMQLTPQIYTLKNGQNSPFRVIRVLPQILK